MTFYQVTHYGRHEATGSLRHCVNYVLILATLACHDGNLRELMERGWVISMLPPYTPNQIIPENLGGHRGSY